MSWKRASVVAAVVGVLPAVAWANRAPPPIKPPVPPNPPTETRPAPPSTQTQPSDAKPDEEKKDGATGMIVLGAGASALVAAGGLVLLRRHRG